MRFAASVLDEIRARIRLTDLIAETVQLKRAGREMRGLSPFNVEKTPSFFVNDSKGFYHCFSSGKHGDHFTWLMEITGDSFPEVVERLAQRAGVAITREEAGKLGSRQKTERDESCEALGVAACFFQDELRKNADAKSYLRSRGIQADLLDAAGIGFSPHDRYALGNALSRRGCSVAASVRAGLLVDKDVAVPFAFYRGRITFPIRERSQRVISFGARAFPTGDPKYLNGRDTFLFDKSRTLYGIDRAHAAIAKSGQAVVVEGYTDVIVAHANGFENVVAPLGTSITAEHLQLLWKVAPTILVCTDSDKAGERSADRVIETAMPFLASDRRIVFAELPGGMDPDETIRKLGPGAFASALGRADHVIDRLWVSLRRQVPGDEPEDRSKLEKLARELTGQIGEAAVAMAYRDDLVSRVRAIGRRYYTPPAPKAAGGIPAREAALVYAAITHPSYVDQHLERLSATAMSAPLTKRLQTMCLNAAVDGVAIDASTVSRDLALLRDRVPQPAPSFVSGDDPVGFGEALDIQRAETARRRLRSS